MPATDPLNSPTLAWIRRALADWKFSARGVFDAAGVARFPMAANSLGDLETQLRDAELLRPLPDESAAIAHLIEDSIIRHLQRALFEKQTSTTDPFPVRPASWSFGGARHYPDLELQRGFLEGLVAVDVKAARRKSINTLNSSITLATGNTHFRFPEVKFPNCLRTYGEYREHLDIVVIYDKVAEPHRVENTEVVVMPTWALASRSRSSGTREYIGSVTNLERLRSGNGEFDSLEDFETFWRNQPWKVTKTLLKKIEKAVDQAALSGTVPTQLQDALRTVRMELGL